eukprot:m.49950 g.49950  ORF g.49950 m.49950 type:complete len:66 (+) comp12113_c0_seq1:104-301(+)
MMLGEDTAAAMDDEPVDEKNQTVTSIAFADTFSSSGFKLLEVGQRRQGCVKTSGRQSCAQTHAIA